MDGPLAIGGSGSSDAMHSVSLSAKRFDLHSAPSGAVASDTTAENAHLPGLIVPSACAPHVPRVAKRMTATVVLGRGFAINRNVACPRLETGQRLSGHQSSEVPDTADDSLPELYIPIVERPGDGAVEIRRHGRGS